MTALIIDEETLRLMLGLRRWAKAKLCQTFNLLFLLTSKRETMLMNGSDMDVNSNAYTSTCAQAKLAVKQRSPFKISAYLKFEKNLLLGRDTCTDFYVNAQRFPLNLVTVIGLDMMGCPGNRELTG